MDPTGIPQPCSAELQNNIYCGLLCYTGCGPAQACHNGFLDKPKETGSWPCGFGTEGAAGPARSRCCCQSHEELCKWGRAGREEHLGAGRRKKEPRALGKGGSEPGSGLAASKALEPVWLCLLCNGLSPGLAGFELPRAALILGPCCCPDPAWNTLLLLGSVPGRGTRSSSDSWVSVYQLFMEVGVVFRAF